MEMLKVRRQVEYYLSHDNLSHDNYLTSLMDEHGMVPIGEICKFRRLNAILKGMNIIDEESQIEMIIKSCEGSEKLTVSGSKIGRARALNVYSEPYNPQPGIVFGIVGVRFSSGPACTTKKPKPSHGDANKENTDSNTAYSKIARRPQYNQ